MLTGADGETPQQWPLPGIPSRTRISDGMLTTTAFAIGHSYAPTTISTQTVIRSLDPTAKTRTT
ncbi:hypothetical protein [Rathayibacter sp. VKM Ac-2926]|uniref:hypothetical protein n=1 Tax=Rathayibacter sp. VKM Ac-2926 TaxID=2929477 RepID=UPI001FB27CDA|nr:hypothetical protein [Rathayibacter sp. VKM Ac-2926]